MKTFFSLQILVLLALALFGFGAKIEAQGFGLSVSSSANSVVVSNSLTYTINLTNLTGVPLADVLVTNLFSAPVSNVAVSNSPLDPIVFTATNYGSGGIVFDLQSFASPQIAQLTLIVQPTTVGFITNTVTVTAVGIAGITSTNLVTQVTNLVIQADLGVTVAGPTQPVIVNDWMTYEVTVTNAGPAAAPDVLLTNTLPAGLLLTAFSPTNQTYQEVSNNFVFDLGTLPSGGSENFQFTFQPLFAGNFPFAAAVGMVDGPDVNPTNDFAATNITVINYLAGTLTAVTNSAQTTNPQNGLTEQSILLSNTGSNNVVAARVVVTGLTNELFNAVGTNNGNPFVTYGAMLAAGKSVNLLLQFSPRGSFPFTNGQLQAFAVPLPDWIAPTAAATGTNINISRIIKLSNGDMLLEFPSTLERTYTVVYSDNVLFSNALVASPAVVAPANETQWIDYGPPLTISAPTNSSARFYQVFANP